MLSHWDNLDRTVERGYAGFSLWDWHKLPDYTSPQYDDYARAVASIGINGTVLTNVNADALVLTAPYLEKVAALADVFRPYGIRVYLTARFSAPIEIGKLATADPLDREVVRFWADKAAEIYRHIPDFGGFLVKANAEGQPGPQDYGRTHADGANLLADALRPHGGIVVWRAFVYTNRAGEDRAKQAYDEFKPLDGAFRENAFLQVKNGPIDFQPREPFHPLFGAMKATPLIAEFQITQEYLGFATHLAYLATLFQETLDSDTFAAGPGSTVARVLTGEVHRGIAGGMAAALVTTFYGLILANMVFLPMGGKLQKRNEEEILCRQIITEGIASIINEETPAQIQDKLESYIPQSMRKFDRKKNRRERYGRMDEENDEEEKNL